MGKYITYEQVRIRLIGKVRFTDDETDENKMHILLANRLICEAEGEVELDLSPRYAVPLQTVDGEAFSKLPAHPTKELVRTLAELKACIRILETDFGSGSVAEADKYIEKLARRYDKLTQKLIQTKEKDDGRWKYPPLPSLMLAYFNTEADDGFAGQVLVSSEGQGDYPKGQINNPSQNFWNGEATELDGDSSG